MSLLSEFAYRSKFLSLQSFSLLMKNFRVETISNLFLKSKIHHRIDPSLPSIDELRNKIEREKIYKVGISILNLIFFILAKRFCYHNE